MIIRYLTEFDEVLKYANELSGTIDLDTTLAQSEVLFMSFQGLMQDLERDNADAAEAEGAGGEGVRRRRRGSTSSHSSGVREVGGGKREVSAELTDLLEHWEPEA